MITPNTDAAIFCEWLETSAYYRFSPQRLANIAIIKAASIAATEVTNVQYNDFVRFTGHLYSAFIEFMSLTVSPQYQFGMNRKIIAYQNTDVTHTGDLNQTIMASLLIPANVMDINSVLWIELNYGKIGVVNTMSIKFYINTIPNSLIGAVQVGLYTSPAAYLSGSLFRYIANKNAINSNYVISSVTSLIHSYAASTAIRTALNIDFSVNQYVIITMQLANAADTARLDDIQVYVNKP